MFSMILISILTSASFPASRETIRLESPTLIVEIDARRGTWHLVDRRSSTRWPSEGSSPAGSAEGLKGEFTASNRTTTTVRLATAGGDAVVFSLVDNGHTLEIRYEGKDLGEVRLPGDVFRLQDGEDGFVVVPCREGLLIPGDSGLTFEQTFGSSEYEGCHMNMLGLLKQGSALLATWDDANVWVTLRGRKLEGPSHKHELTTELSIRPPARAIRITPLGKGDWNTLAEGYRRIAERMGLASTMTQKIARNAHAERLLGAANVKLWTCLNRRMNEESSRVEHEEVEWTFDEAAQIAEHIKKDLGIDRCLFILGGWTEGGYDVRHPDALPANKECGGNIALSSAARRIQELGYVGCLHDNYQDMYRDAKSWDPKFIQKRKDGSLTAGGRWLGGRAYLVCAPKQVELAIRPQNLPAIQKLFPVQSYFIDTTYAAGPQECFDPAHPIGRNDDIAWKIRLSDAARQTFGLFGSECGREWALPHSDFFEGLVGVGGKGYHSLKPESLGALEVPFWEMVYHDCQVCYGKYGYDAAKSAPYVARHVLAARPLHYHSMPHHLYWKHKPPSTSPSDPLASLTRSDRGWAEGMHPMDVFLKNTQEVLGPLNLATAHERLTRLEFLDKDRKVRRATYGTGLDVTVIVVNEQPGEATVETRLGGSVLLPPWGFVVESPRFAAFFANRWGGYAYPEGSLFTIRAEAGPDLVRADRIRIFHGFGDPRIHWLGSESTVPREEVIHPVVARAENVRNTATARTP